MPHAPIRSFLDPATARAGFVRRPLMCAVLAITLPLFKAANCMNAYNTYLLMEQEK
jgi:hypothetical protein